MKLLRTIALAAVLAMAGCATLFNGTSQRIQVISEPPGAEVFLDGELAGTTPTEVVVSRRLAEHEFRVVEESGNAQYRWLRRGLDDRAWLNIFSGAFVGWGAYFRSAEDNLEGNLGIGIFAALIPIVVDLGLGGAHEFPDRIEFGPRSAVGPLCVRDQQQDVGGPDDCRSRCARCRWSRRSAGRCAAAAPPRRSSNAPCPAASRSPGASTGGRRWPAAAGAVARLGTRPRRCRSGWSDPTAVRRRRPRPLTLPSPDRHDFADPPAVGRGGIPAVNRTPASSGASARGRPAGPRR